MPLIIDSLRGGDTHTQTHTHINTYTDVRTETTLRNQVRVVGAPGLKMMAMNSD